MNSLIPAVPRYLTNYVEDLKAMLRQTTPTYIPPVIDRIHEFEKNIVVLEADIARQRNVLALLKARRQWMQKAVRGGQSLLAPIRRLPREILHHIFTMCCEEPSSRSVFNAARGAPDIPIPMLLTTVCTLWRDIVLSMPDLWKVLEYDMSGVPLNVKDCERCLRLTKIFLEYAGSSPLSIFVYGVTKVPDETMGLLDLLFDAWCRRAGQWAEVALNFPQSYLERNSYQLTKGSLKNLHTIHITELNAADGNRSTYNFLAPCRALRSAELSLSLPRSNGLLPSLPWHQLETLALTLESTGPNVSQLLPLCKNVKKLTISIHGLDLLFPDTTVYTLPKVQHLTIHEASPHNSRLFSTFFRCFTLPNLVSLDVDTSTYIFGDVLKESDFSGLLEFLQRSSSRLTSLTLRGECLSSERVVYLLKCLEELTTLHLVESRFRRGSDQTLCTPYVFEHLVASDIFPGSLLPQLLHLKATEVTKYLPCKELVAAILSRCGSTGAGPGVERLQSVEVELYDYMLWADDLPRSLRQLKDLGGGDEGLKVIVR